jgi:hypothetical protein
MEAILAKAARSGITVQGWHIPLILGMLQRGDRKHDIAAWFGLNQGRIKNTEDGLYGTASPAPMAKLPPSGSPGPKALALRGASAKVEKLLKAGDAHGAIKLLGQAMTEFDKNE